MALYEKVKWVLGIVMVFLLILMTNLVDRNNFVKVKNSITTIYEDRLIAHELIVEMLKQVHEKELSSVVSHSLIFYDGQKLQNDDFTRLINLYEETKLTKDEDRTFQELKHNLEELPTFSEELKNGGKVDNTEFLSRLSSIKENLSYLQFR